MLMSASEHISMELDLQKNGHMGLEDANTLVRVLCHKKDREASKFLKKQYHLPISSGDIFMPMQLYEFSFLFYFICN